MKFFEESRKTNELLKSIDNKYKLNDDEMQEQDTQGFKFISSKLKTIAQYVFNEKKPIYLRYINPNKEVGNNLQAVEVLYCIDGDTFVGMQNGEKKSYRLSAIDTPELGLPWSKESKALVETMIDKKIVYVTYFGLDKYGRKIVDCFLDPEKTILVNNALIKEGLSHYHNYSGINKFHTHNFLQIMKKQFLYLEASLSKKGKWGDSVPVANTQPKKKW